jgi:hypothetical protein
MSAILTRAPQPQATPSFSGVAPAELTTHLSSRTHSLAGRLRRGYSCQRCGWAPDGPAAWPQEEFAHQAVGQLLWVRSLLEGEPSVAGHIRPNSATAHHLHHGDAVSGHRNIVGVNPAECVLVGSTEVMTYTVATSRTIIRRLRIVNVHHRTLSR